MITAQLAKKPAAPEASEEATQLAKPGDCLQLPKDKIFALSVTDGPQKGEVFRLNKARVLIGRKGADIVLNDPQVSRQHCVIVVSGDTATLMDLGTTNGTGMNGKKITHSCELEHLSELRVGTTSLRYTVRAKE
ncbi:MAG: FHA domain-containing protein [Candidatus Acidiferrales bacterium]